MQGNNPHGPVLVTGATGYVGGRLWRLLEGQGRPVRCLARRPDQLMSRVGATTEVVSGDVLQADSLDAALTGIASAYYLVHSLGKGEDFAEQDRTGAQNFARATRRAGIGRIIYLGGLGHGDNLSPHLKSRQEVGEVLRESGVPVIELRASIVIGSGSLSFEMIRALVERLPLMITPRWVEVKAQPIAVDDLLAYLVAALDLPLETSRIFEIGGADQVSYRDLMAEYARQRGLRRVMLPVPLLTPKLSSLWLGLVAPLYARVGRKLIESIKTPTVVRETSSLSIFSIKPRGMREAIAAAIKNEELQFAQSRWHDAFSSGGNGRNWAGVRFGSRLIDSRACHVPVGVAQAFAPISCIGGKNGWYAYDWLWRLRGFFDLLIGGVGARRGRPDEGLQVGAAIDFWRVEAYEPDRLLRLAAEMKLPGRAWLEFEVVPNKYGTTIRQTTLFDPLGLTGLAYWYATYPLHRLIFSGMLKGIACRATQPNSLS